MIKSRREARGITQQELADAIGVSRSVVNKWESGQRTASGTSIRGLERVLGTSAGDAGTLTVNDASDSELLAELLRRRLAAERAAGIPSLKPALPAEDLEWPDTEVEEHHHTAES